MKISSEGQAWIEKIVDARLEAMKANTRGLPMDQGERTPVVNTSWLDLHGHKSIDEANFHFDKKVRFMIEQDPSGGGFLTPAQWANSIVTEALEKSIVMPRATVYPMTAHILNIPGVETVDHDSNSNFPLMGGMGRHAIGNFKFELFNRGCTCWC